MKRLKVFGLLVVAICVCSAVASSSASAAKMVGAEFSVASNGTTSGGAGTLFGTENIECTGSKGSTTEKNKKEGTYTLDFEGCKLIGKPCWSLGDKSGTILTGGSYQLVLLDVNGKDDLGIALSVTEVHIECELLKILVKVKGSVIGLIAGPKGKTFEILVKAKGKEEQEVKEYLNEEEKGVEDVLSCSVNEGTFEPCGEEAGKQTLTTEKETELLN